MIFSENRHPLFRIMLYADAKRMLAWRTLERNRALAFRRVVVLGGFALLAGENLFGDDAGILPDRHLDFSRDVGIGLEEAFGVLAALADALAVVGEPGAGFLHDAGLDAEIDQFAVLGYAFAIHDVELDLLERRRQLVLDHFYARLIADHLVAFLDGADAADIEADGSIEFERVAAGGGFRRAVHDADLHADLVDEDHHGVGAVDRGGELAQRLAHQAGLQAGLTVAHLAFELGARHQGRDRIDDQHVDRAGAHQGVGDFERLLAGVRLRDQKVVDQDAKLARIDRIERMFGIDEGTDAALLLRFGQAVQRQRGLARRFGPVDLDDPAARQPADAERDIEAERARGNDVDIHRLVVFAEPHDRALAKAALDLGERRIKGLRFVHGRSFNETKRCCTCTHDPCSLWPGFGRPATKRPLPGNAKSALYTICSLFAICSTPSVQIYPARARVAYIANENL